MIAMGYQKRRGFFLNKNSEKCMVADDLQEIKDITQ
jgi:hypothetical protein